MTFLNPRLYVNMKNQIAHQAVEELFQQYSATEIVEMFETLDLFLFSEGLKEGLSEDFEARYEFVIYLLKRVVRALEPAKAPPTCEN